jgi:hypothetical protein
MSSGAKGARRVAGAVCCVCDRAAALCVEDRRELRGVVEVGADRWLCAACARRTAALWAQAALRGQR